MTVLKTNYDHPDYLEHRCDILDKIKESKWYHGEHIYKMHGGEATQWYFMMVSDYAQSFDTPVNFCPYCGERLPL